MSIGEEPECHFTAPPLMNSRSPALPPAMATTPCIWALGIRAARALTLPVIVVAAVAVGAAPKVLWKMGRQRQYRSLFSSKKPKGRTYSLHMDWLTLRETPLDCTISA